MNKINKIRTSKIAIVFFELIKGFFWLFILISMSFLALSISYRMLSYIGFRIPKNATYLVFTDINYQNLLKVTLSVMLIEFSLFSFIILIMVSKGYVLQNNDDKFSDREVKIIEILIRFLLAVLIPFVALFSLTENQFSSLVNIFALYAIISFVFKFKIKDND